MKLGWVIIAAGVLAACGQKADTPDAPSQSTPEAATVETVTDTPAIVEDIDYAALANYGDDWYISGGWPGEYPAGFVILDEGVSADGRAMPRLDSAKNIACALPRLANYQIWNAERVEADKLDFFVATKTFPVTLTEDASIEIIGDAGVDTLDLKSGDQLKYLRYLGEGFTIMSFNGIEHDINEAELRDISDIGNGAKLEEDLWISVPCGSGERAWLNYKEILTVSGIVPSPIVGYGESSDLTEDEVESARDQASALAGAEN